MHPSSLLDPDHYRLRLSERPRHPSGFSLIELLIVVAIIGVIAAIAVPNLLQSKAAANEASAIVYMRNWTSAQELYLLKYGVYADADQQLVNDGLTGKGSADSHGYSFSLDNPLDPRPPGGGPGVRTLLAGQAIGISISITRASCVIPPRDRPLPVPVLCDGAWNSLFLRWTLHVDGLVERSRMRSLVAVGV